MICKDVEYGGHGSTRWFKYDRDYLCVNKPQFVPVIFEPPCNIFGADIPLSEFIYSSYVYSPYQTRFQKNTFQLFEDNG
jgi:hypothetical protein